MAKNPENRGKFRAIAVLTGIAGIGIHAFAGKQRLILQIREPMRNGHVSVTLPAVTNAKGEIRDLKSAWTGDSTLAEGQNDKGESAGDLVLDMAVTPVGRNALEVFITLPEAAFVELFLLDHNGKVLGTLLAAQLPRGVRQPIMVALRDKESGGPGILAMRVGKKTIQRLFSQVKG